MSVQVYSKGYPRNPQVLSDLSWFYETARGIELYIQADDHTNAIRTRLPWKKLQVALARHRLLSSKRKKQQHIKPKNK